MMFVIKIGRHRKKDENDECESERERERVQSNFKNKLYSLSYHFQAQKRKPLEI